MEKKKKRSGRAKTVNTFIDADMGTVFHSEPPKKGYNIYDNEIAFDNLTNDVPGADLQDLV